MVAFVAVLALTIVLSFLLVLLVEIAELCYQRLRDVIVVAVCERENKLSTLRVETTLSEFVAAVVEVEIIVFLYLFVSLLLTLTTDNDDGVDNYY